MIGFHNHVSPPLTTGSHSFKAFSLVILTRVSTSLLERVSITQVMWWRCRRDEFSLSDMSAIQVIFEPPKFVYPEEHRRFVQTTPASFGDIPPVLRHQQDGIKVEFDPPLEGLSTDHLSSGTLYLVERCVLPLEPRIL